MLASGEASPDTVVAKVAPGAVVAAWSASEEIPEEAYRGLAALRDGRPEDAYGLLVDRNRGEVTSAKALAQRWELLETEDLTDTARYHQLLSRGQRRAYCPILPHEAEWAKSVYPTLARSDGVTLKTDLAAVLDIHQVTDPATRQAQLGFIAAMDEAHAEYRARVEGARSDERMKGSKRGS
jgi:hypothetical protein